MVLETIMSLHFKVKGSSMWPLIKSGDVIFVSPVEEIQNGDIITLRYPYDRILTHRVIDCEKLITKGDNNTFPDKSLLGESYDLIGKIDHVVREGKKIDVSRLDAFFYKYSRFESKVLGSVQKIILLKNLAYLTKRITYPIAILVLKLRHGKLHRPMSQK